MSLSLPLAGRAMVAEGREEDDAGLPRLLVRPVVLYGCCGLEAVRVERRAGGMTESTGGVVKRKLLLDRSEVQCSALAVG